MRQYGIRLVAWQKTRRYADVLGIVAIGVIATVSSYYGASVQKLIASRFHTGLVQWNGATIRVEYPMIYRQSGGVILITEAGSGTFPNGLRISQAEKDFVFVKKGIQDCENSDSESCTLLTESLLFGEATCVRIYYWAHAVRMLRAGCIVDSARISVLYDGTERQFGRYFDHVALLTFDGIPILPTSGIE
jgi:hypothetical protein